MRGDVKKKKYVKAEQNGSDSTKKKIKTEVLGSIATDKVYEESSKYLNKSQPEVLRESCVVALDFADYNNTAEFQYADTLAKV